jgi:hypothetical protein
VEESQNRTNQISAGHKSKPKTGFWATRIVGVVVIVGLSFFAGTRYEHSHDKSSATSSTSAFSRRGMGGFGGGFGNRANLVFGQVTAISSSSIMIEQTRSNTSTTLTINASTTVTDNGQPVSVNSIQTGDTVIAMKSSSSSSTATSIRINPTFGGAPSQNSSGSATGSSTTGSSTSGSATVE